MAEEEPALVPGTGTTSGTAQPTPQPWEGLTDPGGGDQPGGGGTTTWQRGLYDTLLPTLEVLAREQGMFPGVMETWLSRNYTSFLSFLDNNIFTSGFGLEGGTRSGGGSPQRSNKGALTNTIEGLNLLAQVALQWVGGKIPGFQLSSSSGGSGAKPLNVRAQFDLSQLASEVSKLTNAYLLQDHADPRGVARAYVDAVVANPEQKLDFETFVVDRLKANPRWTTLYRHKPKAISELQYISQYTNIGQQMLGANRGWDWSGEQFHGMALGADPQAFQQRLQRSNSFTSQAPYVTKLQERVSGLSHILKG